MTPEQAISELKQRAEPRPIYLLLGEERYLRKQVTDALRQCVTRDGIAGLNEDEFSAGEAEIGAILGAARTLPMMAKQRWVLVRDVERWETKDDAASQRPGKTSGKPGVKSTTPLDQLAEYAASPAPSTVLVLQAAKLNARRRLLASAKKLGFLVQCDPLPKNAIPDWIGWQVNSRRCRIERSAADLIAEVAGPDLSTLDDAVERLCLYVGEAGHIEEETVAALIPIVRPSTVWQLVEAVSRRDVATALAHLAKVYDAQDRGLRLLGVLAWSTRQLIRFRAARDRGMSSTEAAREAGVPPFRARSLEQQLKHLPNSVLDRWLVTLRDVDLDLKGGTKRPALSTLETALIELCRKR